MLVAGQRVDDVMEARLQPLGLGQRILVKIATLRMMCGQHCHDVVGIRCQVPQVVGKGFLVGAAWLATFRPGYCSPVLERRVGHWFGWVLPLV